MKDNPANRALMFAQAVEHSLEVSYPTGGLLRNGAIDEAQACLQILAEIAEEPERATDIMEARFSKIDWSELYDRYRSTVPPTAKGVL